MADSIKKSGDEKTSKGTTFAIAAFGVVAVTAAGAVIVPVLLPLVGGAALIALATTPAVTALGATAIAAGILTIIRAEKSIVSLLHALKDGTLADNSSFFERMKDPKKAVETFKNGLATLATGAVNAAAGITLFSALGPLGILGTVTLGATALYMTVSGITGIIASTASMLAAGGTQSVSRIKKIAAKEAPVANIPSAAQTAIVTASASKLDTAEAEPDFTAAAANNNEAKPQVPKPALAVKAPKPR